MSRDLGRDVPDLEKLYARKLWADFSYPNFVRGLLGTGPPDPTLESASPSPAQGSIWHRFHVDSTSK